MTENGGNFVAYRLVLHFSCFTTVSQNKLRDAARNCTEEYAGIVSCFPSEQVGLYFFGFRPAFAKFPAFILDKESS